MKLFNNKKGYLDASTGGMILGSMWQLLVGLFTALGIWLVKVFWNPIKKFFKRIFKGK